MAGLRPTIVDLFCGAGGATRGYQEAGFHVIGVDINHQPHYCGDEFVRADAMTFEIDRYDAVHASPPCQDHSVLSVLHDDHGTGWMLEATIARLEASGLPWVVENVPGSPIDVRPLNLFGEGGGFVLCGSMFGLGVRRHRLFASSLPMAPPPCRHHLQPNPIGVTGHGAQGHEYRRGVPVANQEDRRQAMGIDWMNRDELAQAIPPAYTEWIGQRLLKRIEVAA